MNIGKIFNSLSDWVDDLGLALGPLMLFVVVGGLMWIFHIGMGGLSPTWGPVMLLGGGVLTAISAADWWVSGAQVWIIMIQIFMAGVWIASAGWLAVILN